TWVILKGRTRGRKGSVRLKDTNPLSRPDINFRYFQEGSDEWRKDLDALKEGIRFAAGIMEKIQKASKLPLQFLVPKPEILKDDAALEDFIQRESWGHHACGTCRIGGKNDKDPMNAVLDGDFRVLGVKNLRVVDASVFPKIPGFFIVSSIYMIS